MFAHLPTATPYQKEDMATILESMMDDLAVKLSEQGEGNHSAPDMVLGARRLAEDFIADCLMIDDQFGAKIMQDYLKRMNVQR